MCVICQAVYIVSVGRDSVSTLKELAMFATLFCHRTPFSPIKWCLGKAHSPTAVVPTLGSCTHYGISRGAFQDPSDQAPPDQSHQSLWGGHLLCLQSSPGGSTVPQGCSGGREGGPEI